MGKGKKAAVRARKEERQAKRVLMWITIALLVLFAGFFVYSIS